MEVSDKSVKSVVSRACGIAVYGFLMKDGELVQVGQTACHASAMRGLGPEGAIAIINKRCQPGGADEDTELYYNWLINESPCADAFITKDPKIANESHTIVDLSKPRDMVGNALVATRGPWEKKSNFKLWAALVRLGIEGHVAYGFITLHQVLGNGAISIKSPDSYHWMICGSALNVTNLIYKDKWPKYTGKSYTEYPGWGEASARFRGKEALPQLSDASFNGYYNKVRREKEGVKDNPDLNIFQRVEDKKYEANITYKACANFIKDKWL